MGLRVWCDLCWGALAPVKPSSGAEHGGAPIVLMPAVPRVDRRRSVTKPDLAKYGYTEECPACTQLTAGNAQCKGSHDDRCRDRIVELVAGDGQ